jgi:hypothetical protein
VWQLGWANNNPLNAHLAVWDTLNYLGPPSLLTTVPVPATAANYDRQVVRNASGNNLVATLGWDGLAAVDVSNPASPRVQMILADTAAFYFDGVRFVPGSDICLLWGVIRIGAIDTDFIAFLDATLPGLAFPIAVLPMPMQIADVGMRAGRVYVLGSDRATRATTLSVY